MSLSEAALPASEARRRRRAVSDGPPPAKPGPWPWLDRGGRFSAFKAAVLLGCFLPLLFLGWWWVNDEMGAEPLTLATHQTGDWAIYFLLIGLAVTPARWIFDWQKVLQVRRMLGLAALGYAVVHLLLYVGNEHFRLFHVLLEILKRSYLTLGFTALIGLCVLGWTSTDSSLRRLGREWKLLHRLTYLLTAMGILHFYMQSKINVSQPVLMTGFFLWLMFWRLVPARWRGSVWPLFPLALLAAAGAAGLEYLWYATQTRAPAGAIFASIFELDFEFGIELRPAAWMLLAGLAVAVLAAGWALVRRMRPAPEPAPRRRRVVKEAG
ncbi:sulfite oxidase heme-binding subunit YedZ [Muricoccus radiodurans]|uniref:sulfite oxidase heme-binding subunit YedZ n=1 Tax=Muricoccus radiodurans TaxID=2231721 RepID=UPI003CF17E0E